MLPQSYELPAALLLMAGGALACFAGYRLFRVVLAIYGFILGAGFASSMVGSTNTAGMVIAALVGGLVGSLVLVFAYFVGIALVGAGLGAFVAHAVWSQIGSPEPPALAVIGFAILGAAGAMLLQRYVIVVGTAFGGAWTLIVGAVTAMGDRGAARAAANGNVWILYPLSPAAGQQWVTIVWLVLGAVGAAVQLGVTAKKR
jgi:Domain of unknown function (DUF4203)